MNRMPFWVGTGVGDILGSRDPRGGMRGLGWLLPLSLNSHTAASSYPEQQGCWACSAFLKVRE